MLLSIIIFVFTLFVLVIIHELGHFFAAKKFGIKVLEFGFGIPPRAWGKKFGETLVSLNWLPVGGFVRLLGEDEEDKAVRDDKRSFAAQTVEKRILVVLAGVLMNFLAAWVLFYIVLSAQNFKVQLPLLVPNQFVGVEQNISSLVLVDGVQDGTPASDAGLKQGDRIVAINGEKISADDQIVEKTKQLAGAPVKFTISDPQGTSEKVVEITPRKNPPEGQGPLGVRLAQIRLAELEYKTPTQKLFSGITHSWNLISYSGKIMGTLISESFKQKNLEPVSQSVAGPVGITSLANSVLTSTDKPLIPYLDFVALISLNLAVMNLLPIPALDGGRLFFLLVEFVTRKKVHAGFERWVHTIGMAILLLLTLLITYSDIRKFFN